MAQAFSWFLALRYLRSRWVNLLGMAGVALAIWALIVVVAVFSGFISGIRKNTEGASAELLVTGLPHETSFARVDTLLRENDADLIAATSPRLRHYALYFPRQPFGEFAKYTDAMPVNPLALDYVELVGIDPARENRTTSLPAWLDLPESDKRYGVENTADPFFLSQRRYARTQRIMRRGQPGPTSRDDLPLVTPPGILFGAARATSAPLMPGQEVSVVSVEYVPGAADGKRIRTFRRVFTLSGAFESKHRVVDHTVGLVSIEEIRTLLGHDIHDPFSVDIVTDVAVKTSGEVDLEVAATRLRNSLRAGGLSTAEVLTWEQQNALFLGAVDQERGMMKLILFAVILVSAFLIYATMHMMVTQKIKDIGILSAVGAARQGIRQVFMLCGVTIAVVGCTVGTVIGCLTAFYLDEIDEYFVRGPLSATINTIGGWFGTAPVEIGLFPKHLYALDRIPTEIEPSWVLQVSVGAFVLTLLAAWLPARRAARFEPVRALGYE